MLASPPPSRRQLPARWPSLMPGRRLPANTRRVLVQGFPFSVVYRDEASGIVIFAVAHQSRRPDYWAARVQDR